MSEKKLPQRMCIACRQMKEKAELIRIVKSPEGNISVDKAGKAPGRGAFICRDSECLKKCRKSRLLNRAFKMDVDLEIYDRIEKETEIER